MAAAFVSYTSGSDSRSVTVPAGSDRLLVVACIGSAAVASTRTVTYNGVTLDVASSTNDFVQIHYMLSPPAGAATLTVSGGSLSTVIAAHYTGVGSFQAASGGEGSVASLSFSPSGAGLVVAGISATSASHTPVASTNERHDNAGEWYGDRIVASSGSVTVGVSSATDPDLAGAVFLEPVTSVDASGTAAALLATASGSATVVVNASGTAAAIIPTASGSATVTVDASGAAAALIPTASGTATLEVNASGAVSAPMATATGTAQPDQVDVAGAAAAPIPTATGTATVTVSVSGAVSAPIPTVSGGDVTVDPLPPNCDDRQLTQAQRQEGFTQNRTGVIQAVRPFTGSASFGNLIDYLNRELVPAVRQTRQKVNDTYLQVADNAPSANPLGYYFSTETTGADPTTGRIALNAATQSAATAISISQTNGRLVDVLPWLEVMSGSVTEPLGVVTLGDAVNPGRFIRADLDTMVDQGAYWSLGITVTEASHDNPFVEGEPVSLAFIPGVADNEGTGAQIPPGAIGPVASDTFLGNISGAPASPGAVPLADVDSASITYDATSHTFQRAALTGAIAAAANSNATLFAGIRHNGSAENDRSNLNFVSSNDITLTVTDDAANDELEITATLAPLVVTPETVGGTFTDYALPADTDVWDFTATSTISSVAGGTSGRRLVIRNGAAAGSGVTVTVQQFTGGTAGNRFLLTKATTHVLHPGDALEAMYVNSRWQQLDANRALYRTNSSGLGTSRGRVNFVDSTSITYSNADASADDEVTISPQRAALTGFAAAAANSNATTSAEPIITYTASSNMSAERVLSNGTNTVVDLGTAGQAQIDVDDFPLSGLADVAAGVVLGRQVDAGTGIVVALTGAEQGENIRFATPHTAPGTGDLTDYVPAGITTITEINIDPGVDVLFNSLTPGGHGQRIRIRKVANSNSVTIVNQAVAGTAAMRFQNIGNTTTPDIVLRHAHANVLVEYDSGAGRWLVIEWNPGIATVDNAGLVTPSASLVMNASAMERAALTGDVTAAQNSNATTIANAAVTLAKQANLAQSTIIGRAEGAGTGVPQALTPTQVVSIIDAEAPTWTGIHRHDTYIQFGTSTGLPANGDIRKAGTLRLDSGAELFLTSADIGVSASDVLSLAAATVSVNSTNGIQIGSTTGMPILGDIRKGSGEALRIQSGLDVDISADDDVNISADDDITVSATGNVAIAAGAAVTVSGAMRILDSIAVATPTTVSSPATVNDWAIGATSVVRITGATVTAITGMVAAESGHVVFILNASSNIVNLNREDAGSAASARFAGSGGSALIIRPGEMQIAMYDGNSARWRGLSGAT
jgi:hypothetical protein